LNAGIWEDGGIVNAARQSGVQGAADSVLKPHMSHCVGGCTSIEKQLLSCRDTTAPAVEDPDQVMCQRLGREEWYCRSSCKVILELGVEEMISELPDPL
jgi:hypothetical protein